MLPEVKESSVLHQLRGLCGLDSPVHNLMVVEELKSENHTGCVKPEAKSRENQPPVRRDKMGTSY